MELLDGSIVARIQMPKFLLMPEVVVWGDRAFVRRMLVPPPGSSAGPPSESWATIGYREVFAYFAPIMVANAPEKSV